MKLERFKEKNNKRIYMIIFTIACILLVSGVILYRTFAIFEVRTNQNVIKGTVQDPGNIYFAFYIDNEIQKDMPQRNSGYILDEEQSYCGVTGENDSNIKVSLTEDWKIVISGVTSSRTKCNLKFVKGAYILGKPVKAVTSDDGLYEVPHEGVSNTTDNMGFSKTEWRYAGGNPINYVWFNSDEGCTEKSNLDGKYCELWRIIGLVNVKTTSGEIEQRVKIIKKDMTGLMQWDDNNANNWTNASLMKTLNEIDGTKGEYYKTLKNTAINMIAKDIVWNIGGSVSTNETVGMSYGSEHGTATYNDQPSEWEPEKQSIALPYPSDYGYATSGGTKGREGDTGCFAIRLYSWGVGDYQTQCAGNDWLKPVDGQMWSLCSTTFASDSVFTVDWQGYVSGYSVDHNFGVYPTLYLKNNVKIIDGLGTEENPYKLALIS